MLETFLKATKDPYIFFLNVYFVKIKNEHGNIHFNYFLLNLIRTFYKLADTMQDNVILFND